MSGDRIASTFARCREQHRAALVCFVTGGDPSPADTAAVLDALVEGGADLIELGMPFTDPMADGPAIQAANLRALGMGTTTRDILTIAAAFRARHPDVPLILMGYVNPMIRRGADWFAQAVAQAGVDGVICVDLPPEEDPEMGPSLRSAGVHPIRLATPTTDAARLPAVLEGSGGFLYYVSVAGITGKQQAAQASIEQALTHLRSGTSLPIAVGFGVRTPAQARAIGEVADGVVVGSAIVDIVGKHGSDCAPHVKEYVASLRAALAERETVR